MASNGLTVYPAIDIKGGKAVRLLQGDFDKATVFNESPVEQARDFFNDGHTWLHVVDLDGAMQGRPVNKRIIQEMLDVGKIKLQLGGGMRSLEQIDEWLDTGVERVVLGTIAVKYPEMVKMACRKHPDRIVVGLDAKNGMVATDGWLHGSRISAIDLALSYEDAGVAAILHTDIERDGMLNGPNFDQTLELAGRVSIPLILSGGVSTPDDLMKLKTPPYNKISGVIVGRAIYEGKINSRWAAKISA